MFRLAVKDPDLSTKTCACHEWPSYSVKMKISSSWNETLSCWWGVLYHMLPEGLFPGWWWLHFNTLEESGEKWEDGKVSVSS